MMSIRFPLCARLCAAATALLFSAGCGSGLSSILLQVSAIPPNTVRLNASVRGGSQTSTVILERDASNRFIVSSAMLMPPVAPAPNSTQLALDLPAGTTGPIVVRFTVETVDTSVMTNPPPMPIVTHEGCGRVDIADGMLYSLPIALRSTPSPCPY